MENYLLELLKETKEVKHQLIEYNFHVRMDAVNIAQYLPFQSNEEVIAFMVNDHEWNQRKKESIQSIHQSIHQIIPPSIHPSINSSI